ncbi:MAG: diguanylate cyclase [Desulfomonile tiedjei]|nr:diguanylate cyclase [Desulfomonile tiedjei]
MVANHEPYRIVLENLYDQGVFRVDRRQSLIYYWNSAEQALAASDVETLVKNLRHDRLRLLEADPAAGASNETQGHETGTTERKTAAVGPDNGQLVPVVTQLSTVRNLNGEIVGAVQVFSDDEELRETKRRLQELEALALVDPLTTLGNRRYGEMHLQRGLDEMRRYQWPFCVFFVDVDRFKQVNDSFGHEAGDRLLQRVAASIAAGLRSSDIVSRWGGDEFLAIVRNVREQQVKALGEKIRALVEKTRLETEFGSVGVTVSLGGTMARRDDGLRSLVGRVDRLMYESKCLGRNCVLTDVAQTPA